RSSPSCRTPIAARRRPRPAPKALIDMTATDDRASDARRAFRVYKALRDDSQARGRVGGFVDELLDLPSSRVEFDALRDVDDAAVEDELGAILSPPQWPT